jgi:hypothetical protein
MLEIKAWAISYSQCIQLHLKVTDFRIVIDLSTI